MNNLKELQDIRFMTYEEIGQILGVHPETVRRLAKTGQISYHLIGGRKRISNYDLKEYLRRGRVEVHKDEADYKDNQEYLRNLYAAPNDVQL